MLSYGRVIMVGAFNIHVDDCSNSAAFENLCITNSFHLKQHILSPTLNHGHTLDLIFTYGLSVTFVNLIDLFVSDHSCIIVDIILQAVTAD